MSDTIQTIPDRSVERDLRTRSEPFEVTPDLVAANLSFGGEALELPGEMMSAIERIYLDRDFVWPTTVAVTQVGAAADPERGSSPRESWTRISVLGTGFDPARAVTLSLTNAFGFPDASVKLTEAKPNESGFLGVDVIIRAVPKRSADWVWERDNQLVLVATQTEASGTVTHTAEQPHLPPHALWQWVR